MLWKCRIISFEEFVKFFVDFTVNRTVAYSDNASSDLTLQSDLAQQTSEVRNLS